jgi:type IV pilus assembly protein PilA
MNNNYNTRKKKKKYGFTIIEIITVLVVIGILAGILVPNFNKYIVDSKKVEVKSIIREFVMAVETAEISDKIKFSNSDSVASILSEGGEKAKSINKYISNSDDLNRINNLNIEDAKKIANYEKDFEIDKKGNFLRIIEK